MNIRRYGLALLGVMLSIISRTATADWYTHVEEDVFTGGHTAMMLGDSDERFGVVFECVKDKLTVSYFEYTNSVKDFREGVPVNLFFTVDQSEPIRFYAQTELRNVDYIGVVGNDLHHIRLLLSQIQKSQDNILVELKGASLSKDMAFSLSSAGSTTAASEFIKACEIQLPPG